MFNENLTLFKPEHDNNTRNIRRVDESENVKNDAKGRNLAWRSHNPGIYLKVFL